MINVSYEWMYRLQTSLCLQHKPHYIAAGSIALAARILEVKLPTEEGNVWWLELDVSPKKLDGWLQFLFSFLPFCFMMMYLFKSLRTRFGSMSLFWTDFLFNTSLLIAYWCLDYLLYFKRSSIYSHFLQRSFSGCIVNWSLCHPKVGGLFNLNLFLGSLVIVALNLVLQVKQWWISLERRTED